MGERHLEDNEIEEILMMAEKAGPEFWKTQENFVLPNPDASNLMKADLANVLEVMEIVYEDKISLAVGCFKKLSDDQQALLLWFIALANDEEFPDVFKSDIETEQVILNAVKSAEREKEISNTRIYPVSETKYEELILHKTELMSLIAKLRQTIRLLEPDDPRYKFADELLEDLCID